MLVSRFPFPLEKGDKLRAYYQLMELQKTYDVTLVALSDKAVSTEQMDAIRAFCKDIHVFRLGFFTKSIQLFRCLFNGKPFQTGYFYNWKASAAIRKLIANGNYDHIYCQLLRTTEYVKNEHRIPKTLDYMDALSAGIRRRVELQPFYRKWVFRSEARRLAAYERNIFDYFEHKTIISEQDRTLIQHPDRDKIHIVPNGIHSSFFERPEINTDHDFVFVGNMSYPPNIEAVQYIAKHVLPAFPKATFLISGSSPDPVVKALAQRNERIDITGWIDDIRTSYCRGKIFLAPMMIGTGMQNKLLEAMALGVPCVTTPLANNAIRATHEKEIMVGDDVESILNALRRLLENPSFAETIGKAGSEFVKTEYSWEKSVSELVDIMQTPRS